MDVPIYCAANASRVPAAFGRQAGAAVRRLGMSKPVDDDPLVCPAIGAPAVGAGAMSARFVPRYLATI